MMSHQDFQVWQVWKQRFLVFVVLMAGIYLTLLPLWQTVGFQPAFLLIILYHWSLYRPDLLSVEHLVLVSFIQDGVYAYPLGFSALRFLVIYALLTTQKRILAYQKFIWVWGGFGIFVFVDALVYGILLFCMKHEWPSIGAFVPGMLITIGFYPISVWILDRFATRWLPA